MILCACYEDRSTGGQSNILQAQRDAVNDMEAEMAFIEGRFLAAATFWGKVMAPNPSFEELALKFVGSGSPDALQTYLLTKLDTLAPADKAQVEAVFYPLQQACLS